MKIPKSVKVGSANYAVEWVDELIEANTNKQRWGECDHVAQTIRIVRYAEPGLAWSIFLHEVLHALAVVFDFPLPETTIGRLADPLMTFLVTNGMVEVEPNTAAEEQARQKAIEYQNKTARNLPVE